MASFELRSACNELIAELKNFASKKDVIKLSVDIQLPNKYDGNAETLLNTLRIVPSYLSKILINGLINIELSLRSFHNKTVTMTVNISGQGTIRTSDEDLKQLEIVLKSKGIKNEKKLTENSQSFELTYALQTIESALAESKLPFHNKKILLAEDNEINAMVFSSFLEEWGCENTTAVNGAEAVSQAHEGTFDAILMDIHMPVLNGNQATQKIREFSDIPIIALTASPQETDIRDAMKAGANDYLLKPVSSTHLFQVLSKYLLSAKS